MPPKKLKNHQATHPATALAACEDLMLCILARLPVKSTCKFKSVCKHWNHLFSTQEFIKMQFKLSNKSKNQSFLVHRVDSNTISVFNIGSNEKILDQPFNDTGLEINIVGCCNGLVCIKHGQEFVLWNPAMNLSKTVSLPVVNLSKTVSHLKDDWYFENVSLGFGYDAEGDDFKVVRIVGLMFPRWVEVYSVNSDSWTTIDLGFQFYELWTKSDGTVNGNPYWVAKVNAKNALICFDVSKLFFKIVSLSSLDYNKTKSEVEFVDLNGSLGAIVFTLVNRETIKYVDAWVFDDGEQIWTKSHNFGPIEVKMKWVLRSLLEDGKVLGKWPKGQLFVFNSETKCVKSILHVGENFEIYDYTASSAFIQGMEKVTYGESDVEVMYRESVVEVMLRKM